MWRRTAFRPLADSDRYLTGLSIGVHLLNLLCLPGIVLVYYYRPRAPMPTQKAHWLALRIYGAGSNRAVHGIVPGIVKSGRLVRAVLCQHARHVFQQRCHRIYHLTGGLPHLGCIRKATMKRASRVWHSRSY